MVAFTTEGMFAQDNVKQPQTFWCHAGFTRNIHRLNTHILRILTELWAVGNLGYTAEWVNECNCVSIEDFYLCIRANFFFILRVGEGEMGLLEEEMNRWVLKSVDLQNLNMS